MDNGQRLAVNGESANSGRTRIAIKTEDEIRAADTVVVGHVQPTGVCRGCPCGGQRAGSQHHSVVSSAWPFHQIGSAQLGFQNRRQNPRRWICGEGSSICVPGGVIDISAGAFIELIKINKTKKKKKQKKEKKKQKKRKKQHNKQNKDFIKLARLITIAGLEPQHDG